MVATPVNTGSRQKYFPYIHLSTVYANLRQHSLIWKIHLLLPLIES